MERLDGLLLYRISWLHDTSEAVSFPRGINFVLVNKNNENFFYRSSRDRKFCTDVRLSSAPDLQKAISNLASNRENSMSYIAEGAIPSLVRMRQQCHVRPVCGDAKPPEAYDACWSAFGRHGKDLGCRWAETGSTQAQKCLGPIIKESRKVVVTNKIRLQSEFKFHQWETRIE